MTRAKTSSRALAGASALLLAAALAGAAPAPSAPAREVLAAHCRAREALSTLRTRFVQRKVFAALGEEETSSGTFHYRRPDAFRWEYAEPDGSFTVVDGRRGWAVFPRIRQARRLRVDAARREGLLGVVGFGACGPSLAASFEVTLAPVRQGGPTLALRPLQPEAAALFRTIELTLDPRDHLPRTVVLHEVTGDSTRFDFLDLRSDLRVEGSLFQFAPPEDYEVID